MQCGPVGRACWGGSHEPHHDKKGPLIGKHTLYCQERTPWLLKVMKTFGWSKLSPEPCRGVYSTSQTNWWTWESLPLPKTIPCVSPSGIWTPSVKVCLRARVAIANDTFPSVQDFVRAIYTFHNCRTFFQNILDKSCRYYACDSGHRPLAQVHNDYSLAHISEWRQRYSRQIQSVK